MTRREELLTLVAAAYQGFWANPNLRGTFNEGYAVEESLRILQRIDEVEPVRIDMGHTTYSDGTPVIINAKNK